MNTQTTCTKACRFLAIASILLIGSAATANTTNTIPFEDSFEIYGAGGFIVGTNGWHGGSNTYATVTNDTYTYLSTKPLAASNHNFHVVLDTENGAISNMVTHGGENIWVDLMLQATRWSDEGPPAGTNDRTVQVMAYVNSNGHIVVYHCATPDFGTFTNQFTEFIHTPIDSNDWIRLTINITHTNEGNGLPLFALQYDGGALLESNYGYSTNNDVTGATKPGPWHIMPTFADAWGNVNAGAINSVAFSGTGFLDDFVVTATAPVFSITWLIEVAVNNALGASTLPAANFMVGNNASTTVTINVSNYWTEVVTVDGVVSSGPPATVTFTSVTAPHTVQVDVVAQTITVPDAGEVPKWWLNTYTGGDGALTNAQADTDMDGKLNWEEWLGSTDPNDSNSVFEIIEHYSIGGTGYVAWVSKAIDPALQPIPFKILKSTNLTVASPWTSVGISDARGIGAGGTNLWIDPSPEAADVPVFYRVSATN